MHTVYVCILYTLIVRNWDCSVYRLQVLLELETFDLVNGQVRDLEQLCCHSQPSCFKSGTFKSLSSWSDFCPSSAQSVNRTPPLNKLPRYRYIHLYHRSCEGLIFSMVDISNDFKMLYLECTFFKPVIVNDIYQTTSYC